MSEHNPQENIDLKAIFRKLAAKWWLFLITTVIAGALAFAYIKTTPKSYAVGAVMRMSEGKRSSFGGNKEEFLKGSGYLKTDGELVDEISVLTSIGNNTKTLKRLDFGISYYEKKNFLTQEKYDYPPFKVKLDSVALQICGVPVHVEVDTASKTYRVKAKGKNVSIYNVQQDKVLDEFVPLVEIDQTVKMGQPFRAERLSFTIDFPEDRRYSRKSDYFFVINSLEGLVVDWRNRTGAEPQSDESNIVTLSTSGEVVNKQIHYLDKLMETYIEGEQLKQQQKGLRTIDFIQQEIGGVSDSLKAVQKDIRAVRTTGIFDVSGAADQIMSDKSRLMDERSEWLRKKAYCEQILNKLETSDDYINVPPPTASGLDDPQLNSQISELIKVSNDRAAQNVAGKNSPVVIQMDRRIRNLRGTIIESARGLVQQAEISLQELNGRLGSLSGQVYGLAKGEGEISSLSREFQIKGDLYNYLMEKKYEAGIAIASDQVDKTIVDDARVFGLGPIKPDKKVAFGAALLLGIMLPLVVILVRDFFNDKISGMDELKRLSPVPVLATIPTSKRKRVTADEPKSLLAESFRTARINLQYLNADALRQVLGFTSSTSGEGKTFCAINLSTVMAMSGKRVLLIDADMRRPKVHEYLELKDAEGLSNILIGESSMRAAVQRTDVQGLDVITAGPLPPNPLELIESPRLNELLQQARAEYDHVIIDASPLGLVSEFKILMSKLDVTLYVVRNGYTRRGMLRGVNDLFKAGMAGRIDLLLNDVKAGEGYGDGYGYYTK